MDIGVEESLDLDINYDQEKYLQQDNKTEKLSIMGDFNDFYKKINNNDNSQNKTTNDQSLQMGKIIFSQYYAKIKKQAEQTFPFKQKQRDSQSSNQRNLGKQMNPQHARSVSGQQSNQNQLKTNAQKSHIRHPSCGDNEKKMMESGEMKRNYSSVEEKKKILQPSNQLPKYELNTQKTDPNLDYFGDSDNFVSRKVHGKKFINDERKYPKIDKDQNMQFEKPLKEKANHSKQNDFRKSNIPQKQIKKKNNFEKNQPKIILFKKVVDLSMDTKSILAALTQQRQNFYEGQYPSQTQSSIDQGLFAKAIVNQRGSKPGQNGQDNRQNQSNSRQDKEYHQICSPISTLNFSPNPTSPYGSIFKKKKNYIR